MPLLSTFSRQSDCTVMIMAYDPFIDKCLYLNDTEDESLQDHPGSIGMSFPAMESVTGHIILGTMRLYERQALMKKWQSDYPVEVWKKLIDKFDEDMKNLNEKGYSVALSELYRTLNIIAVPLKVEGGISLSLACTASTPALTEERIAQGIGDELITLAKRIENRMTDRLPP